MQYGMDYFDLCGGGVGGLVTGLTASQQLKKEN